MDDTTPTDSDRDLREIAQHEAGHILAHWFFSDRIIAVTLQDHSPFGGAVYGNGHCGTLIGERHQMVVYAAGCAAVGEIGTTGDDREKLITAVRRIHGLVADGQVLEEEIANAEARACWLCRQYGAEIQAITDQLLRFHLLLANMERKPGIYEKFVQ
jgi:hypothetical protein